MEFVHKTKTGEEILLSQIEDRHLINIIKHIQQKAKEGWIIESGGGNALEHSMWYDREVYEGEVALKILNYSIYANEAIRRWEETIPIIHHHSSSNSHTTKANI